MGDFDSPMPVILKRAAARASQVESKVDKVIRSFWDRAEKQVSRYLQRRIEVAFRLAKRSYPELTGVTFGNGTHLLRFTDGSQYREVDPDNYPPALAHLDRLCEMVEGNADDVPRKRKEKS